MVKLKIRLRVQGVKNNRTYRIVVAKSTVKRDGKYLDYLGFYNPRHPNKENQLFLNINSFDSWVEKGAQATESVNNLAKRWRKLD